MDIGCGTVLGFITPEPDDEQGDYLHWITFEMLISFIMIHLSVMCHLFVSTVVCLPVCSLRIYRQNSDCTCCL